MRLLRIAVLAALAAPGVAFAAPDSRGLGRVADSAVVPQDLPIGDARTLAVTRAPIRFHLVGLHWQGRGTVVFRTRALSGRWSVWRPAAPEAEDRPDSGSGEGVLRRRWRIGNPYWVGPSDHIEVRTEGPVRRLRAWYVWSPVVRVPARRISLAGSPQIVPRLGWSADERIRRGPPRYAPAVRFALVHHTAGSNAYGPAASAAIVRAIELYHVKGNGWRDIGYNFLVDRYGQVFEGRYGGMERNVVGAHAEGFNRGSVGVAVLGNYGASRVSTPAQEALARLLAWRLDVGHVDPLSTLSWISGGNARFPRGIPVFLRAISGHRDTGFTLCPGEHLYRRLNALAGRVAGLGLPKLYEPTARGALGGPIRFSGRLSRSLAWTVTVSGGGRTVARSSGSGRAIGWTWDSAGAVPMRYTWTIEAGAGVRPARGTIGRAPPPSPPEPPPPAPPPPLPSPLVTELSVTPEVLSPNGDAFADTATISYVLAARALVTAVVVDEAGAVLATLFADQRQSARRISFPWDPSALADGRYLLVVRALTDDGRAAEAEAAVLVNRTLGGLTATPPVFSPNGDGRDDAIALAFTLAKPALVTVEVRQDGQALATIFQAQLQPGSQQVTWDGMTPAGRIPDGRYDAVVTAVDDLAEVSQSVGFDVSSSG